MEDDARQLSIPAFTYFQIQSAGSGRSVYFSIDEFPGGAPFESDSVANGIAKPFYNGRWMPYNVVFTASGIENETFLLDGLRSDSGAGQYVSAQFMHVVVEKKSTGEYEMDWVNDSDGIFTRSNKEARYSEQSNASDNWSVSLYGNMDKIYTVCLNENKTYEIKFGNGVTGAKLDRGDKIYVFYLQTDGPAGEIDLTEVDFSKIVLKHDTDIFRSYIPEFLCDSMFKDVDLFIKYAQDGQIEVSTQHTVTTSFKPEEDVQDIRENAPGWFKTGNRLITAKDTEYYIKAYCSELGMPGIVDVKCMNNMRYVATLYKWLYENGIKSKDHPARRENSASKEDPGKYYLDNITFNRANFKYVDPADANNTYLWIKTQSAMQDAQVASELSQRQINDKLYHLKTITTEYYIVRPVLVKFAICANSDVEDIKNRYFNGTDTDFDQHYDSYIEITLDDNLIYISSNIQTLIYDEIMRAFDINRQRLGGVVKFQEITDRIYAINGVQRVRTVYAPDGQYTRAYDGISFASWSDESVLHFHEDLQVGNVMRHVEDFQFPVFEGESTLFNRIKIITKAMQRVHAIKF